MSPSPIVGTGQSLTIIYEWEIQNYSKYSTLKHGEKICSPVFYVQSKPWHLEFFPNGSSRALENFASLFLHLDDRSVKARYTMTVINSTKRKMREFCSKEFSTFVSPKGRGKNNFVKSSLITKTPLSDSIKIICEIITEDVSVDKMLLVRSSAKVKSFEAFERYINNSECSDVKLIVENQQIFAHKMVLAANSEVFAAMFKHEMRENKERIVVIKDIKYEAFYELIRFAYTGDSCLTEHITSELLKASNKYQLLRLKNLCEKEMCKNLSLENVIEYLTLADTYDAQDLKKEAIDFIVSHGQEIVNRPDFDSLRSLHSDLFKDVFRSVFARSDQ